MKIVFFAAFLFSYSTITSASDTLFPVPAILEDNIEFWKMIYTKISLKEGVIHDRDFPLVIYDTLFVGTLYGKKLDKYTSKYKKQVALAIKRVRNSNQEQWGPNERKIAFQLNHLPDEAVHDAEKRIRFQLGQRERFLDGLVRSGEIIDTMRYILFSHGIPLQLAYLPHVESSFDYSVSSHAGAAGLWQFMPETGRKYLKINNLIDERMDPVMSTVAAARLLAHNYKLLNSWPLAITAYNYGLTGILKAVYKTGSRDLGVIMAKHESPSFRFASKNFYSCFMAASDIAQNAHLYFGNFQYKKKRNTGTEVILNVQLYPFEIGRMLGVSQEEIAAMNPWILSGVFKKQLPLPGGTKIRIRDPLFSENIDEQIAKFFKNFPNSYERIAKDSYPDEIENENRKIFDPSLLNSEFKDQADSIYNLNLKWPDQRYMRYFNDNLNQKDSGNGFKIIIRNVTEDIQKQDNRN